MSGDVQCQAAKEETDFETLFAKQKEGLPRSPKAQEYLKSRGLEQLEEVGYNSGINWKKLKQCITFPLKDKNGNITSLYGRRIIDSTPGFKENYSRITSYNVCYTKLLRITSTKSSPIARTTGHMRIR